MLLRPTPLLAQYLAQVHESSDEEALHQATPTARQSCEDEISGSLAHTNTVTQHVISSVPPEWLARLIRVGLPMAMQDSESCCLKVSVPPETAPGLPENARSLLEATEAFQVTVRSCLRLLQGSLALLCGRGITVPMAPIAGMLANDPEREQEALASCAAVRDLGAALLRALAAGGGCLVQCHGDTGDPSCATARMELEALSQQAGAPVRLTVVQEASSVWARGVALLLPCLLRAAQPQALIGLTHSLQHLEATLRLLFRLPTEETSTMSGDCPVSDPAQDSPALPTSPHPRLRPTLQSLGRGLAMCRASLEERFVASFLAQATLAQTLSELETRDEVNTEAIGLRLSTLAGLLDRLEGSSGVSGSFAEQRALLQHAHRLAMDPQLTCATDGAETSGEKEAASPGTDQEEGDEGDATVRGHEASRDDGPSSWAWEATGGVGDASASPVGTTVEDDELVEVYAAWAGAEEESNRRQGGGQWPAEEGEPLGRGVLEELKGALACRTATQPRGQRVKCQGAMRVEEADIAPPLPPAPCHEGSTVVLGRPPSESDTVTHSSMPSADVIEAAAVPWDARGGFFSELAQRQHARRVQDEAYAIGDED